MATHTWRPAWPVAWLAWRLAWPLASLAMLACGACPSPSQRFSWPVLTCSACAVEGVCSLQLYVGVVHCRANAQQPKLFVGMILILIFAEALALYGLIGALLQ